MVFAVDFVITKTRLDAKASVILDETQTLEPSREPRGVFLWPGVCKASGQEERACEPSSIAHGMHQGTSVATRFFPPMKMQDEKWSGSKAFEDQGRIGAAKKMCVELGYDSDLSSPSNRQSAGAPYGVRSTQSFSSFFLH